VARQAKFIIQGTTRKQRKQANARTLACCASKNALQHAHTYLPYDSVRPGAKKVLLLAVGLPKRRSADEL